MFPITVFPGLRVSKNYSKKKVSRLFPIINIPGFTFLGFFTSVKNERFMSKSVF